MSELLQKLLKDNYVLEKTLSCAKFMDGSHVYFPKKLNDKVLNKKVHMLKKDGALILLIDD